MNDAKQRLHELENQLQQKLNNIHADFTVLAAANSSEQAIERENDEVLNQLEQHVAHELRLVRSALQDLTNGVYGICHRCGAPIAPQRLAILPFAQHCQHCA